MIILNLSAPESVTVRNRLDGSPDQFGNATKGFGPSFVVEGCAVDPGSSTLTQDGYRVLEVTTQPRLYAPADSGISAGAEIVTRIGMFIAVSNAAPWRSPYSGSYPGDVIDLKAVN